MNSTLNLFLVYSSTGEPNEANEPLLKYMNSVATLQRAYQFFHCRTKQAGSFGKLLTVALHSVVAFKESVLQQNLNNLCSL